MSRIIYAPQFPTTNRYPEWALTQFHLNFQRQSEYTSMVLGGKYINDIKNKKSEPEMFSPINEAIELETEQIKEYMNLKLENDDTLFLSDISFPGFFSNVLYHKKIRAFSYNHALSLNAYDYFEPVRTPKFMNETAHSLLFEKIFVGTYYHANKIFKNCSQSHWNNLEVIGLPIPPFECFNEKKTMDIISVARPCIQKVNKRTEKFVKKTFGLDVHRPISNNWKDYYKNLSRAKILLITGKEDTFNYSILEAVMNNTIVLAPNRCSYPELLPMEYIYCDNHELEEMIKYYLVNYHEVPKLKNWNLCNKFWDNLNSFMRI